MDLNEVNYELGLFLASPPSHASKLSCPVGSSVSTADTTTTTPPPHREVKGARRVRNACLQCRERKIRCSRTYPCKGCISRGDGAACDWQGGFPTGNISNYQKHVADQRRLFEELQDRISCAKACLSGGGVLGDCNYDAKTSPLRHSHRIPLYLPSSVSLSQQEPPLWFSTDLHFPPPGSAASNLSSLSTNTVESSQYWPNEEFPEYSPSSADLQDMKNSGRGGVHPADLFGTRHKHGRYRSLSLLVEGDGRPFDSSRPYLTASSQLVGHVLPSPTGTAPPHTISITNESDSKPPAGSETRGTRVPGPIGIGASSSRGLHGALTVEAVFRPSRRHHSIQEGMEAIHHPFPSAPTTTTTTTGGIDWPSGLPRMLDRNPCFFQNHARQRSSSQSCKLEPRSPVTPHRHLQNFNRFPPSIGATQQNLLPTSVIANSCQQYLPQHQYLGHQDIAPITEPNPSSDFHHVPWGTALPRDLEQAVQAGVAMGFTHGAQYCGFMPSGTSLGE